MILPVPHRVDFAKMNDSDVRSKWKWFRSVDLARQLNERCLEFLCGAAADDIQGGGLLFGQANRDLWILLDPVGRERISTLPFSILDVRFSDGSWWIDLSKQFGSNAHRASIDGIATPRDHVVLEIMMFAWQAAREDRRVASMLLGLAPSVAETIANWTMREVRIAATLGAAHASLRWVDDRRFWREMLHSAIERDDAALEGMLREARLRFCGQLIRGCEVEMRAE
jgi:hypothetical protein